MQSREDILAEAISENEKETERWQLYRQENQIAIENIDMFMKRLQVDVMVPVGRKAFMPGKLIHTNEVLVGHFQGYFSKCSSHTAKEICQFRFRQADEHLQKLSKEAELWTNKLETPHLQGAFPNENVQEIIEEYTEEEYNEWLKGHKESVKKWKREEYEKRKLEHQTKNLNKLDLLDELKEDDLDEENKSSKLRKLLLTAIRAHPRTDDDIMEILDQRERIEEENEELDKLDIDKMDVTNIIQKMMLEDKMAMKAANKTHESTDIKVEKCEKTLKDLIKDLKKKVRKAEKSQLTDFLHMLISTLNHARCSTSEIDTFEKPLNYLIEEIYKILKREEKSELTDLVYILLDKINHAILTDNKFKKFEQTEEDPDDIFGKVFTKTFNKPFINAEKFKQTEDGTIKLLDKKITKAEKSKEQTDLVNINEEKLISEVKKIGLDHVGKEAESEMVVETRISKEKNKLEIPQKDNESKFNATPAEVDDVRAVVNYLPLEDKIEYYRLQIKVMQEKSKILSKSKINYNEKYHIIDVILSLEEDLEALEDKLYLEGIEDKLDLEALEDKIDISDDSNLNEADQNGKNNFVNDEGDVAKKRRISFAMSEETLLFRQHETVAEMLPKVSNSLPIAKHECDIKLNEPLTSAIAEEANASKKKNILKTVEKNLAYVRENQSVQDFDIVGQCTAATKKTLHITFKHSNVLFKDNYQFEEIPATPADFYKEYLRSKEQLEGKPLTDTAIYLNAYKGEDQVKVPILTEAKRAIAYKNPHSEFFRSGDGLIAKEEVAEKIESATDIKTKSILRNKLRNNIEQEIHHITDSEVLKSENKINTREQNIDRNKNYNMKIMDEVARREQLEPDPLPECKFIDTIAPKKRTSYFKKQRMAIKKT